MWNTLQSWSRNLKRYAYRHRMPVAPKLQESDLSRTDEDLALHADELAYLALGQAMSHSLEKARFLPQPWRAVVTFAKLDAQVGNGGFHQFFTNTRGHLDSHLLEDLGFLVENPFQPIITRAFTTYQTFDYRPQWRNIGRDWEFFSAPYKEGRFEQEDQAYFALQPSLTTHLGRTIREKFPEYRG